MAGERQSDPYADVLAIAKLEQLLESFYQSGAGDWPSAREIAEHLVTKTVSCEFLISKGQARITLDLRPAELDPKHTQRPPADPVPTE